MSDEPSTAAASPEPWSDALARTGRAEIGLRRGRGALMVVGGVVLTALTVGLSREVFVLGVVLAVFFGLCTVAALWSLLVTDAVLVLTAHGIERPRARPRSLTWTQVRGARVDRQPGSALLVVEYVAEDGSPAEKILGSELLDADLEQVAAWISEHGTAART